MRFDKIQTLFLLAILLGAFFLAFSIFRPFLGALALAAIFAVVLEPLYRGILRSLPGARGSAALLTMLICLVGILVPLSLLSTQIFSEAQQLYGSLSGGSGESYLASAMWSLQEFVRAHVPGMEYFSANIPPFDSITRQALLWIMQHLGDAFTSVTTLFFDLLVFLFALFYLLRDGAALKQRLVELSPLDDEDDRLVADRLELAINSIVRGNLAIALIQGVQIGVALSLFGVPNPTLWGAVGAVVSLIPGVGTALVFVPTIFYLYLMQNYAGAFGIFLWWVIAVTLIDNTLSPRIIGRGAKLHPLIVLLSVLGGVALFGPEGVFFGPLCISLFFALLSIYAKPPKTAQ